MSCNARFIYKEMLQILYIVSWSHLFISYWHHGISWPWENFLNQPSNMEYFCTSCTSGKRWTSFGPDFLLLVRFLFLALKCEFRLCYRSLIQLYLILCWLPSYIAVSKSMTTTKVTLWNYIGIDLLHTVPRWSHDQARPHGQMPEWNKVFSMTPV